MKIAPAVGRPNSGDCWRRIVVCPDGAPIHGRDHGPSPAASSIAWPFLVVLVFWLLILFMGFGLFAPGNTTVIVTLSVGALSVAGAVFLILELDQPYAGLMHLSSAPLRNALAQIGH